jgi:hypothetical protein
MQPLAAAIFASSRLGITKLKNHLAVVFNLVIPRRLERLTYCLEGSCSIQLSYGTTVILKSK